MTKGDTSMAKYEAGEITTNGVSVPIFVDDDGDWTAEYAGKVLSFETRDRLKGCLSRLTQGTKVELEIPVVGITINGYNGTTHFKRGVLTGLHGSNGNVLSTWTVRGQKVKEQITSGWSGTDFYVSGDVTDEQLKEYAELMRAKRKAVHAEQAWRERHEIKPKNVVQRTIDARLNTTED